jgi:hypothetical protein
LTFLYTVDYTLFSNLFSKKEVQCPCKILPKSCCNVI